MSKLLVLLFGLALTSFSTLAQSNQAAELFAELQLQALSAVGTRYKFGGTNIVTGVDCSGFTRYIYNTIGIALPRTVKEQALLGIAVDVHQLYPGDLIFFSIKHRLSHVGVYIGDSRFVHSSARNHQIKISEFSLHYWAKHYTMARRVLT